MPYKMTVRELIEHLNQMEQGLPVYLVHEGEEAEYAIEAVRMCPATCHTGIVIGEQL